MTRTINNRRRNQKNRHKLAVGLIGGCHEGTNGLLNLNTKVGFIWVS
jgi:hypothetical protein